MALFNKLHDLFYKFASCLLVKHVPITVMFEGKSYKATVPVLRYPSKAAVAAIKQAESAIRNGHPICCATESDEIQRMMEIHLKATFITYHVISQIVDGPYFSFIPRKRFNQSVRSQWFDQQSKFF